VTESLRKDTAHREVLLCHYQWEFQDRVTDGITALQELQPNLCCVAREPITDHLRKTLQKLNDLWNVQWTLTGAGPLTVGSTTISLYVHDGNYIKSLVLYC